MPKKRKDGYLKATFTYKKKRYYVYGKNKDELFEKEKEKREELESAYNTRINPTIAEYYERWKERYRKTVSEASLNFYVNKYRMIKKIYVKGTKRLFVDMLIKDITIDDLYYLQDTLLESGKKTSTVNDCVFFVRRLLYAAEDEHIIKYNPGKNFKDLKRTEDRARDTIHRALTHEEQSLLFSSDAMKYSSYYNVYRFAILTGMRIGEIGALKLSDIKDGYIHIQRTVSRDEKGKPIIGKDAKTASGKRTIPISDELKKIIAEQREKNKKLNGNIINIDDVLFRSPKGYLIMPGGIDKDLVKICNIVGIDKISMHGFRATFATRCIESGMNPRTLQEILGHKDYAITMNLYGHVLENTKKDEMEKVHIVV